MGNPQDLLAAIMGMEMGDEKPPRKNKYATHRAVTKDDTRGYTAEHCAVADARAPEFVKNPGSARDLIWHFIAANIGPDRALVRLCDPAGDLTDDAPVIYGIRPDVKGSDLKGESSDDGEMRLENGEQTGRIPADVLSDVQKDFATLNGQGRDLVLQRLRDVGHNPVDLGLIRDVSARKSKTRKVA